MSIFDVFVKKNVGGANLPVGGVRWGFGGARMFSVTA